ncbi:MAG: family 43 glycosylhydrolase, partial [Roseburia sp.]|nr:family 43 glycosylhydrolase [Roseburia sp.]
MFYRPKDSVAADVIPFYKDDAYQLFYLRDFRNVEIFGEGTPWYLLETKDFVHFKEKGEAVPRGEKEDQDLYIFTGSVFEKSGINYIFYTGHNPYYIKDGKKQEVIMRAISKDFNVWEKDKDFSLAAPDCFEPHDFRDPFVFFNEETGEYNILLAARLKDGPDRRRGCTALAVSKDLDAWTVKEKPFYAPGMYFTHECPDLFKIGEWWYLVFSEFTEKFETHYRMAKSLNGPWLTPEHDTFDNRHFYAAKSVYDGVDRYIIGWNPTNNRNKDFDDVQWGGNIVVHKIVQDKDGQLYVKIPDTVKNAY